MSVVQALDHAYANGLDDATVLEEIGCMYCKQGAYAEAVPVLKRVTGLKQGGVAVHMALAESLVAMGQPSESADQLQAAQLCATTADEKQLIAAMLSDVSRQTGGMHSKLNRVPVP
jgi:predicted Zn-dependent protease